MNNKIKNNNTNFLRNLISISYATVIIVLLTIFCQSVGYPLILPLFIYLLGFHLIISDKRSRRLMLSLSLLLVLAVFLTDYIKNYTQLSYHLIPVASFSMLTMLLFNSRTLAFTMAFASSLVACLILNADFELMFIFFLGSLVGSYAIRDSRRRSQVFIGGLFVSIIQSITLVLFHPKMVDLFQLEFIQKIFMPDLLNGFLSTLIVIAFLKPFEMLFGVVTNFSLLELSDGDQPLLKKMVLEAPGTYHHSLIVSNLAETAAQEIGAHALLIRVGAYYHDIGKLVMPNYFTENQLKGGNVHDHMEPSMSRLVVLNHVKEGIELAKKHKLSQSIVDFIPQHHGTSIMYYFYKRAMEGAQPDQEINEGDFRYPGPKPQTRETAIVMLADSVEGATRSIHEPTAQSVEDTVRKVINNKFIDGQLDECPLTLKEIDKISNVFIRMLTAMYHNRVKYPEMKKQ